MVALVAAGRILAGRQLEGLRRLSAESLWEVLGTGPDGRPAVIAFSTPGCAACRTAQKPALIALQERAGNGLRVIEVDVVEQPRVARVFGVLTVPATAVLDPSGAVLAANQGFATADRLAAQLGLRELRPSGQALDRS